MAAPAAGSRWQAARAIVELFHFPPILVVLLACGLFSVIAAEGSPPYGRISLYLAAVLASQMAVGAHNDYCDRALDAAAKPNRAIPAGIISPRHVLELTCLLLVLSVGLALPLGLDVLALGVLGTSMGFLYNAWAKSTVVAWLPFWLALPTIAISSFAVVDAYSDGLLLAYAVGLPLVLPVYIADSLIDVRSDRQHGSRGLTARLGPFWARTVCWSSLAIGFAVALLSWPENGSPGTLTWIASALFLVAIISDRLGVPRVHWLGVMLASVSLGADWLLDISP
jgi:4-hydroxybenzoate polyprenyltransferase